MLRPRAGRPDGGDDLDDPLFSLLVTVADLIALAGGTLAIIFAVGYAAVGRGLGAWGPNAGIALGLVGIDAAMRGARRHRKRREWLRYHPEDVSPSH
jgi:hypothetical protein